MRARRRFGARSQWGNHRFRQTGLRGGAPQKKNKMIMGHHPGRGVEGGTPSEEKKKKKLSFSP